MITNSSFSSQLTEHSGPPPLDELEEDTEVWQSGVGGPEETHETNSEQFSELASGQHIVAPPAKHLIHVPV